MSPLGRLTRRADYLAANSGRRAPTPGFVLLVRDRADGSLAMRVGITVSGKVGGAVIRNRMKRRFRELVRAIMPESGIVGADHVLIGRQSGIGREFALLRADLEKALRKLKTRTDLPELVEGRSFLVRQKGKKRASTSSAKPDQGSAEA